jgi:hypothetical protein
LYGRVPASLKARANRCEGDSVRPDVDLHVFVASQAVAISLRKLYVISLATSFSSETHPTL